MNKLSECIVELTTVEQWKEAFPIMNQLRTDLTEQTYIKLLQEMEKEGYRLFALNVGDEKVAVAGISLRTNFYNKRHVYVYDLVTDVSHRSNGYGEKLLNYVHSWAREKGAEYVALESGIQRIAAHRFYEEKLDYDKWCFSFRRALQD
ncbi:GNAT family N-acetyltransferase [Bacillus sp. JJ1532]|uniref:GNAT family N-acetyltransferase n=1 Tax=Bacillus sp. JJ1532 TaxID=3122958 RepID=UPI002FFFB9D8